MILDTIFGPSVLSYRLVRVRDGQVYNHSTGKLETDVAFADSLADVSKEMSVNGFVISAPDDLPAGNYHLICYDLAKASVTAESAIYYGAMVTRTIKL